MPELRRSQSRSKSLRAAAHSINVRKEPANEFNASGRAVRGDGHLPRAVFEKDVLARLRRIEGQVRGIITMIEAGRSCDDIAEQMAAARRAMDKAFFRMMACSVLESVAGSDSETQLRVEHSTKLLERYS